MAIKTFSTGEVLTASDTNTFLANAGLVYITGGTQSGSTAWKVDNCFTSTYRNYRIVMSNIAAETAGRAVRINFRASGATNTNANYDYGYNGFKATGTTNNTGASGQTFAEIGVYLDTFGTATLGSATFDVITPQISTERTFGLAVANGYEGAYYWRSGGFVQGQQTAFDGFRISLSGSGNVAFTWAVYGYRIA